MSSAGPEGGGSRAGRGGCGSSSRRPRMGEPVHVPMAASRCTAEQAPALATTATPAVEHHDYC